MPLHSAAWDSSKSHAALGPILSLLIVITIWRHEAAHQEQVQYEFKHQLVLKHQHYNTELVADYSLCLAGLA